MPPKKRKARSPAGRGAKKKAVEEEQEQEAEEEEVASHSPPPKKISKKEEARLKKEAEKKRKEEEAAAKSLEEKKEQLSRVTAVLKDASYAASDACPQAIFVQSDTCSTSSTSSTGSTNTNDQVNDPVVPRALLNAVQRRDLERARTIIHQARYRYAVDVDVDAAGSSTGNTGVTSTWKLPFPCPKTKTTNSSALTVALANDHIPMADLLAQYFGWSSALSNTALAAALLPPSKPQGCSDILFQFLIQHKDPAVANAVADSLPYLANEAMKRGKITFVRRVLRHCLGLPFMDADLAKTPTNLLISLRDNTTGTLGVTPLHLLALEATAGTDTDTGTGTDPSTTTIFKGFKLDQKTTNAPALNQYITPLHLAALSGNLDTYKTLQEAGGDWTIHTNESLYCLNFAAAAPPSPSPSLLQQNVKQEEDDDQGGEQPKKKRAKRGKQNKQQKSNDDAMDEGEGEDEDEKAAADKPKFFQEFVDTVRPADTLRYMTTPMEDEDLAHEFNHSLSNAKRKTLKSAIEAGRHHNVAWLIHSLALEEPKETTKWYNVNAEMAVLQAVIQHSDDPTMLALFLAQPKFRSTFVSEGKDFVGSAVNHLRSKVVGLIADEFKDLKEAERATLEFTPVHLQLAIQNESLEMVKAIVALGVDPNSPEVPKSALHVACGMDFVECAKFLLDECGANPRAVTSPQGVSVMQAACRGAALGCIQLLLDKGVSLDLKKENEILQKQKEQDAKNNSDDKDNNKMETEETSPFEGWFMVLTGVFSVSKDVIKSVIESQGGKVQPQVNGKTTHCVYSGKDGYSDYGQKMGQGDKKYTAAKRKKLPFLNENDILRYLKRTGQGIASHETSGNLSTGDDKQATQEASFLHDIIKNCANKHRVLPAVRKLLEHGADLEFKNDTGRTPFHYAVLYLPECESNVQLLTVLDPKGDLTRRFDKNGCSPILEACTLHKWKFVLLLLHRMSISNVNIFMAEPEKEPQKEEEPKDKENEGENDEPQQPPPKPKYQNKWTGWSLGHLLLVNGKTELFQQWVKLGGDVNTVTRTPDATPLVVASIWQPEICRMLLMNPNSDSDSDCNVNATTANGKSLLHAVFGGVQIGKKLTAEEESQYKQQGIVKPHVWTARSSEASIIQLTNILTWNPDLDASLKDAEGTSVFHAACASESATACVRALLKRNRAILHTVDGLGNTPLAISLLNSKLNVSLFLMDQGADINGYVYWRKSKNYEANKQQDGNSIGNSPKNAARARSRNQTNPLGDDDGESVDEERLRLSFYSYVMLMDFTPDVVYTMLSLPSCDMDAALQSSITMGNLTWTERLIRSVNAKTPAVAGKYVRLLFACKAYPTIPQQERMLQLSKILVANAGGMTLDTSEETGYNVIHTAVAAKMIMSVLEGLLKLLDKDSVEALLSLDKNSQTPLHMAVAANGISTAQVILSYTKEHGGADRVQNLLDTKDTQSKTALHYAVGNNSLGTYLSGAMLSLLVRYGSKITIPDQDGLTVAAIVGQMHPSQLDHFKLALSGKEEDGEIVASVLPKEALEQIATTQAKRKEETEHREKEQEKDRKEHEKQWTRLKKQWEEFRAERLKAKPLIFEETRNAAASGRLFVPVDRTSCPDPIAYQVHIGSDGDIYDALLVTSDLRYNVFGTNSFHALQLVELTDSYKKKRVGHAAALATAQQNEAMYAYRLGMAKYRVVERWGRIGESGGKTRAQGFTELSKAISHFEKVFKDKTRNEFSDRENFEAARGAYNWVQKVYDEAESADSKDLTNSDGSLPKSVDTLLRAITSLTRVRMDLRDGGFGVDDLPLGQLSPNTISEAYKILNEIEALMLQLRALEKLRGRAARENRSEKSQINSKLTDLSNKFYTTIPHDFGNVNIGFRKPEVINYKSKLEKCLQMLASLEDVESSVNLLLSVSAKDTRSQRLRSIYELMGCNLHVVTPGSDEFNLVELYAIRGAMGRNVKIAHLLRVDRFEDSIRFVQHESTRGMNNKSGYPMNQWLWHGSKMSNFLGILMKGFKIAPPEAPASGYNFGKGIYLADMFGKSASYASARRPYYGNGNEGKKSPTADVDHFRAMLLCEVAIGEPCELRNPNPGLTEAPEGYDSVRALGRQAPDGSGMFLTKEGVGVPLGEVKMAPESAAVMGHNEYIVYDESRVRIKYAMLFA
ncbi:polymerase 1 [Seminavis robusta]|uniref:Poly [ADP-ribose] polymerase n=1 Tax=Seminavis robusta TaxID=568900 RepID=A0A9N8EIT2_9STRA|nr:polymerase 1 [Seminavis robusta]|eukprot:Sro1169_g248640.1 polymerase 1 (2155) ;mRNA; f:22630-29414